MFQYTYILKKRILATLKITELPINIEKIFEKLKYGGPNQGYVNFSTENISGNRLIKIKPVDTFSNDDFEFMQDVKLINPTIVQPDTSQRNNSGVFQAKIVPIDSTETTYWANETTVGDVFVVMYGGNEFEIPIKQYLGSNLQFIGINTGLFSRLKANQPYGAIYPYWRVY